MVKIFALSDKDVGDVARKLSMIWNVYDFFTTYATVDDWEYDGKLTDPSSKLENDLDVWVISRLHQLVAEVEERVEAYDINTALRPVLAFVDDVSNWFVRRSRRRFWKAEDDTDKADAYLTLHYVLTRLAYVMAPFTPFLAEELYHNMTGDEESVHLKDWLPAGNINEEVMNDMELAREFVNQGLSIRARAGIKVRQPLSKVTLTSPRKLSANLESIIAEELNVKEVRIVVGDKTSDSVELDLVLTDELKLEGAAREIIRNVQQARKEAGLEVDDRINLWLSSESKELTSVLDNEELTDEIAKETLTIRLNDEETSKESHYATTVEVDGHKLEIKIVKSK
ncbi:MAG: class I tRNA ligase family protein [Candidatus Saccharibacteria bacterium]